MERKKYVKPIVLIEDFMLSQCIAACSPSLVVNSADRTCLPDDIEDFISGTNLFSVSKLGCGEDAIGSGLYDGYCYHTYSENQTFFTS